MATDVGAILNDSNPAQTVGMKYGVPACAFELANKVLSLFPMSTLIAMRIGVEKGKRAAQNDIKALIKWLRKSVGLENIIDEDGRLAFISRYSLNEIDLFSFLGAIQGYLQALQSFGASMYAQGEALYNEVQDAKKCIESFNKKNTADQAGTTPGFDDFRNRGVFETQLVRDIDAFVQRCDSLLIRIDAQIAARQEDPSREPKFVKSVDPSGLFATFTDNFVEEPTEIFRLSYGPPRSKQGQFILSVDGLYYDSQTSGLTPVFTEIARRKEELENKFFWNFEQDPNLGGRGKGISSKEVKEYVNNTLDINKINDSQRFQKYYDEDNYLEQLIAQRNKRIYDLSAHVVDLENDGSASEADKFNLRQSLLSESAAFQEKVNKRKKQIELAVAFGGTKYKPGKIPLNDFSYLANKSVLFEIEKQKQLTLDFDDVDGIILPVTATYVTPPKDTISNNIDHLVLSLVGEANILNSASSYSGIVATNLPLQPKIETNGLVAVYNFLETNIELPSSTQYLLDNCITNNNSLNGKLMSLSISSVFGKGLGIPYLDGIVDLRPDGGVNTIRNSVVLPETKELNDILYSKNGATFDFWIHASSLVPTNKTIDGSDLIHHHKIILGNENFGSQEGVTTQTNINRITPDQGGTTVRGFLMGFTRDRRISQGTIGSTDESLNPASSTCFFLAPTQSLNSSAIGFVNKSSALTEENCFSTDDSFCLRIPINERNNDGYAFSSITQGFQHVAVSFDPKEGFVNVYLNGSLMATSAMNLVFPVVKRSMPKLPSFVKANSFKYRAVDIPEAPELVYGLEPRRYTPWVLGGGFTDAFPSGNFLGSSLGGQYSGLEGYLGSFKFYNKTLSASQILNNYEAQKSFFTNIEV